MNQQYLSLSSVVPVVIDRSHCLHCGRCAEVCPRKAIKMVV